MNVFSTSGREGNSEAEIYLFNPNAFIIIYAMLLTTVFAVVGIELHELKRKLWECCEQREKEP
ncbi:MAG: hypothetical protein GSR79_09495 [Desulfurococcales archaeon]|nr:hypothetical protein [Desulfurococcales archaeon]